MWGKVTLQRVLRTIAKIQKSTHTAKAPRYLSHGQRWRQLSEMGLSDISLIPGIH
jgi:hypothetical protein